ncbi:MAG TPA: phosphatidylserine decarboxylase [Aquabacterium sp.]|nr:phosphatidylserine decarboxylase [Aquabacterium sp.]
MVLSSLANRASRPYVLLALISSVAATMLTGLSPLSAGAWLLTAWLMKASGDDPRVIPVAPGAVLSPADGRVVKIERARDPYANRDAVRISVFMSWFKAHSNRACVDGVIRQVHYFPGRMFNAELDAGSANNERNALVIDSHGQIVTLAQVAGLVAHRILCYVKPGDTVMRGQRFGRIRFGSRVDVYVPTDAILNVAPGDKVAATTSILATLP